MPKVSVIIPVYNAQKWIERCLNSVINQTLDDFEIICIDDCSKDSSLEILKNFANIDSRIKVIHNEINGGESKARNIGIANASGEYLAFLDNDDSYESNFLETLYNLGIKENADISKGLLNYYYNEELRETENLNEKIEKGGKYFFIYHWWSAIYKRELVVSNGIKFLENYPLGADILFLNQVITHANKVITTNNTAYNYYRRFDSGDSKILTQEKLNSSLKIFKMIADNINNISDINQEAYIFQYSFLFREANQRTVRVIEPDLKKLCNKTALEIYQKCKLKSKLLEKQRQVG